MNTDDKSSGVIYALFDVLWADIIRTNTFPLKRPLLAHYTSIKALESIMVTNELWFSNPLYMNDLEEMRFGILEGAKEFRLHEGIEKACKSTKRYEILINNFDGYFDQFANEHAFDTYVFCLSEHDPAQTDGLLSMWRGYGGNGNGAAIIFDAAHFNEAPGSPLIVANVTYASHKERREWILNKLDEFAKILSTQDISDDNLYLAAHAIFERIKIFAIFTKHCGFLEEKEWRVAYLRQRDEGNNLAPMLSYEVGLRGIEPKLKLKLEPIAGFTDIDLSMEKIVTQILLGPTHSSPLATSAVRRMLDKAGMSKLSERLNPSTTPFRPI